MATHSSKVFSNLKMNLGLNLQINGEKTLRLCSVVSSNWHMVRGILRLDVTSYNFMFALNSNCIVFTLKCQA